MKIYECVCRLKTKNLRSLVSRNSLISRRTDFFPENLKQLLFIFTTQDIKKFLQSYGKRAFNVTVRFCVDKTSKFEDLKNKEKTSTQRGKLTYLTP